MAYWNGTAMQYDSSLDFMLWAQTQALHGSTSQVNAAIIPAKFKAAYSDGYTYGTNELKKHGNQDK